MQLTFLFTTQTPGSHPGGVYTDYFIDESTGIYYYEVCYAERDSCIYSGDIYGWEGVTLSLEQIINTLNILESYEMYDVMKEGFELIKTANPELLKNYNINDINKKQTLYTFTNER